MLRVEDTLGLPSLVGSCIVSGAAGQSRQVMSANVMEVPDIAQWAQPGDFLITTGFPFRNDPELLRSLMPSLARIGIAALAFKPRRFMEEIPAEILTAAENLGLPVISLPDHAVFSRIVFEVVERVLEGSTFSHRTLLSMVEIGVLAGLEGMVSELGGRFGRPLALVSPQGGIMASFGFENHRDAEILFARIRSVSALDRVLLRATSESEEIGTVPVENGSYHLMPIPGKNGRLIAWILIGTAGASVQAGEHTIMHVISNLLAVTVAQQEATASIEQRYRDMFLRDWLLGHPYSDPDVENWVLRLNLPISRPFQVCAVTPIGLSAHEMWHRLTASDPSIATRGVILADELLILSPPQMSRQVETLLDTVEIPVFGGWSGRKNQWADVHAAVAEARTARNVAKGRQATEILQYEKLGADLILHSLGGTDEVAGFCEAQLGRLLAYDAQYHTTLVDTLRAHLESKRVKDTAQKLFTHYNTVLYRLERIREILDCDLDDPETQFVLQLALRLQPYTANSNRTKG